VQKLTRDSKAHTNAQCLNCEKKVVECCNRGRRCENWGIVGVEGKGKGNGEQLSPLQPLRCPGERREIPSGVRGRAPVKN